MYVFRLGLVCGVGGGGGGGGSGICCCYVLLLYCCCVDDDDDVNVFGGVDGLLRVVMAGFVCILSITSITSSNVHMLGTCTTTITYMLYNLNIPRHRCLALL